MSLCGAMWHYPQSRKTHVFLFFAAFAVLKKTQKNLRRAVWRYPRLPARRAEGEEQERMQKRMKTMDED